jgi:hypothetical protein
MWYVHEIDTVFDNKEGRDGLWPWGVDDGTDKIQRGRWVAVYKSLPEHGLPLSAACTERDPSPSCLPVTLTQHLKGPLKNN